MAEVATATTCDYADIGRGMVKCRHCGHTRTVKHPGVRIVRSCPKLRGIGARPVFAQGGDDPPWWPKDADGHLIPQDEITADDMPCPMRGDKVRGDTCDVCGSVGKPFDVFACETFGECSLIARKKGGKLANCLKCVTRINALANPLGSLPVVSMPVGPVKVAILTPDLGGGGVEVWIDHLAHRMPHDVAVVSAVGVVRHGQKWDRIAMSLVAAGVSIYGTREVKWGFAPGPQSPVKMLPTDADVMRAATKGADVVVSWGTAEAASILAEIGWRGPHVHVCHGANDWARKQVTGTACTHRVGVSRLAAELFPDGAEVIHNGSDAERLRPVTPRDDVRASWELSPTDIAVGLVARVAREKEPIDLARAAVALQRLVPDRRVRPVWIGPGLDGDLRRYREEAARIAGDACVWVDPPACIGDAWHAIDVHFLPSPEEGFGLVVTEAGLVGVPQVARSTGIVPEINERLPGAILTVPVDADDETLGQALYDAMRHERRDLVNRLRQLVWLEFSAARMAARWAEYLRGVVR